MATALERHLAMASIIRHAAKIEADLAVIEGSQHTALQVVLYRTKERAIAAMTALIDAEPDKPGDIRALQNEIKIFMDVVGSLAETVREADEADRIAQLDMPEEEQQIIRDLVMGTHSTEEPEKA